LSLKIVKEGAMTKRERLLALMAGIQKTNFLEGKEAWFFPKYKGVNGYLGTGKVMFVGKNPSLGHFPSRGDKFLYENLKRLGFQNAHITDVIKQRLNNEDAVELKRKRRLLSENLEWLRMEIEILGKVKIVAIGKDTRELLKGSFPNEVCRTCLPHYAWVEKYSERERKKKRAKFRNELKRIKKEVNKISRHEGDGSQFNEP